MATDFEEKKMCLKIIYFTQNVTNIRWFRDIKIIYNLIISFTNVGVFDQNRVDEYSYDICFLSD